MSKETQEVRIIKTSKKTTDFDPRYWGAYGIILLIIILLALGAFFFPDPPTAIQSKFVDALLFLLVGLVSFICGGKILQRPRKEDSDRRELPEIQTPQALPPAGLGSSIDQQQLRPAPRSEVENSE